MKPADRQDNMTSFHTSCSSKEVMGSTSTLQVTTPRLKKKKQSQQHCMVLLKKKKQKRFLFTLQSSQQQSKKHFTVLMRMDLKSQH